MSESHSDARPHTDEDERVEQIVRAGPRGAIVLVGISTAIVVALWFLFYFCVFLPRGVIH